MFDFEENFKKYQNNTKALFESIKPYARKYYSQLITGNFDSMTNCKYFLLSLDKIYQDGLISPLRDEEYDAILEIDALEEKYKDTDNKDAYNGEILSIMLRYHVVSKSTVERLIDTEKLDFAGASSILETF